MRQQQAVGARIDARVWVGLAFVFAACFAWHAYRAVPAQIGIDLWQPWGIKRVQDAVPQIGNPYVDAPRYGDFLYAHARDSASAKLRSSAALWAQRSPICFEPTGTPLFYAALAFLPQRFDAADAFWALVLYAMAGAGAYGAARLRGFARAPAAAIATGVLAFFNPMYYDVAVANVSALQFAALVAILALLARRPAGRFWNARLVPALLALVVLFKPNVLPIALVLMAHYLVVEPSRHWPRDFGFAVLCAAAGIGLGALDLGAGAWIDWWRYLHGMHGGTVLYSLAEGNHAPARMLAERFPGMSVTSWCVLLLVLLTIAFGMACRASSAPGHRMPRALEVLRDPGLAMAIGVIIVLVSGPLVWYHYEVLALLPLLWCVRPRGALDAATALALASAALYSTLLLDALLALHAQAVANAAVEFARLPLVIALFLRISRSAGPGRPAAPLVANAAPEGL